jgi:hypothetical protein
VYQKALIECQKEGSNMLKRVAAKKYIFGSIFMPPAAAAVNLLLVFQIN